jgi:hypothetical protein
MSSDWLCRDRRCCCRQCSATDRQRKCSVAAWKMRICERTLVVNGRMIRQMAVCNALDRKKGGRAVWWQCLSRAKPWYKRRHKLGVLGIAWTEVGVGTAWPL